MQIFWALATFPYPQLRRSSSFDLSRAAESKETVLEIPWELTKGSANAKAANSLII